MNRDEATDYILCELKEGRSNQEIAQTLSQQLKAPYDLVERFVNQLQAQHQPVPPAASTSEPWPAPVSASLPAPDISAPLPRASQATKSDREDDLLVDPELTKTIHSMLRKGRKRSDIVTWVCEKTGVEWTKAQRFVAEIQVESQGMMTWNKFLQLASSLIFILGGLVLLFIGISILTPLIHMTTGVHLGVPIPGEVSAYFNPQNGLTMIIIGVLLMIGGFVGAYLTFQSG